MARSSPVRKSKSKSAPLKEIRAAREHTRPEQRPAKPMTEAQVAFVGKGTVLECNDPALKDKAIRAEFERICRGYPYTPNAASLAASLAKLVVETRKLEAKAKKTKSDAEVIARNVMTISSLESSMTRFQIRPVARRSEKLSAVSSPVTAQATANSLSDRLSQFRAVVEAKGSQVALDLSKRTRGDLMIDFIETLKVPDGPRSGALIKLEYWQKEDIKAIFDASSRGPEKQTIMAVRQAVQTMARKNGKTTEASAILLAFLIGPLCGWNRQLYSAAFEREQASLVYRAGASMVSADDELSRLIKLHDSEKRMAAPLIHSTYHALSAEARSKHGMNPYFVIFDELAQFGADRDLFDVLQTSMGGQIESMMLIISTQAANDGAVLSQLIDYGRKEGRNDPAFCLREYYVPNDVKDIYDEKLWRLANPALGTFRNLQEMRDLAKKAQSIPSLERTFRNLYLNQRVAETGGFLSPSAWDACGEYVEDEELEGAPCWMSVDLSSRLDLTAITFLYRIRENHYAVRPMFFTPKDTLEEREKRDRVPYYDWVKQGFIEAVPGKALDYRWIAQTIAPQISAVDIQGIVFDRWRFKEFRRELEDAGVQSPWDEETGGPEGEPRPFFIPFGQGFREMAPAIDFLEEAVLNERIHHGDNPVLRVHCGNVAIEKNAVGDRKFTKARSFGRIDGMVSLAMGLTAAVGTLPREEEFVSGELMMA